MAVITGVTGAVDSWAGTTHAYLVGTGATVSEATLNMECEEFDATTFASTGYAAALKGLRSWSIEFTAYLASIAHGGGANGLITYTGGYVTNAKSWTMDISRDELDSTIFSDTAKTYAPGLMRWGGSYSAFTDSSTDVVAAGLPSTDASGRFQYQTQATVPAYLEGTIFTTRGSVRSNPASLVTVDYTYRGTGTLTQSATDPGEGIFPDGAVGFDAAGAIQFTSHTGTIFGGNAFWSRVAISCGVGELTKISVTARGTGALTIT